MKKEQVESKITILYDRLHKDGESQRKVLDSFCETLSISSVEGRLKFLDFIDGICVAIKKGEDEGEGDVVVEECGGGEKKVEEGGEEENKREGEGEEKDINIDNNIYQYSINKDLIKSLSSEADDEVESKLFNTLATYVLDQSLVDTIESMREQLLNELDVNEKLCILQDILSLLSKSAVVVNAQSLTSLFDTHIYSRMQLKSIQSSKRLIQEERDNLTQSLLENEKKLQEKEEEFNSQSISFENYKLQTVGRQNEFDDARSTLLESLENLEDKVENLEGEKKALILEIESERREKIAPLEENKILRQHLVTAAEDIDILKNNLSTQNEEIDHVMMENEKVKELLRTLNREIKILRNKKEESESKEREMEKVITELKLQTKEGDGVISQLQEAIMKMKEVKITSNYF